MDCSLPGSSVHGISQARALEWGAIAFSHQIVSGVRKVRGGEVSAEKERELTKGKGRSRYKVSKARENTAGVRNRQELS